MKNKMLPRIENLNNIYTLFVHNNPFIALGGEIHNSSASNVKYLDEMIWPNLKDLNLNTVLVPIYWECIEEIEGIYDFSLIDSLVKKARENNIHLILLWFGLWKNSESMYVPGWMKRDSKKYFRSKKKNGDSLNTISPFCSAAVEKDATAFKNIMRHIRNIDSEENTIIMMQVENEIGLLGTDRDYCDEANDIFNSAVPEIISKHFNIDGTWSECFGEDAAESLMAYGFSKAVEYITSAGKSEYDIPYYTNAWLKQFPWYAGSYPSGGPVVEMHKIWKLVAPSLVALAPDIYVPYVPQVLEEYSYKGNPLIVPEVRKDAITASYALYAVAHCNALCYSLFAVEEYSMDPTKISKPPMDVMMALNIDPSAFDIEGCKPYISRVYSLITEASPLFMQYRGTEHLKSFVKKSEYDNGVLLKFSKYNIKVTYAHRQKYKPLGAGMIIEISDDCFYIIGMMCTIEIMEKPSENAKAEIIKLEEGDFSKGTWIPKRILNGDEKIVINLNDMPECRYLELYKY